MNILGAVLAFTLCPPTIVGVGPHGSRPWVEVRNLCGFGHVIDLEDFALRAGSYTWGEQARVESGTLDFGACHTYWGMSLAPQGCTVGVGVYDVCDDALEDPPLESVGIEDDAACGVSPLDDVVDVPQGHAAYLVNGEWQVWPDNGPRACKAVCSGYHCPSGPFTI
jgi:hypothetical protein